MSQKENILGNYSYNCLKLKKKSEELLNNRMKILNTKLVKILNTKLVTWKINS